MTYRWLFVVLLVVVAVVRSGGGGSDDYVELVMPLEDMENLIISQYEHRKTPALLDAIAGIERVRYGWDMEGHGRPDFYDFLENSEEERHTLYIKNMIVYQFIQIVNQSLFVDPKDQDLVDFYVYYINRVPSENASKWYKGYYERNWKPVYDDYYSGDQARVIDAIIMFKDQLDFMTALGSNISPLAMLINRY
jgi:hypothetical protein